MKRANFFGIEVTLVFCITALLFVSWCSDAISAPEHSGEFVPDRILVKFKAGAKISELHAANKTKTTKVIPGIDVHVVSIPPGHSVEKVVARFKNIPSVEYAEPDFIAYADSMPDDDYFDKQWGMHNIGQTGGTSDADMDAPEAWDVTTGSSGTIIAILDTGIDEDHEDLAGKVIELELEDFTGSPYGSDDVYGHGTHCAGIAAAITNNGRGVAGVGYNCSLMNIKVLDDSGSGTYGWVADGIVHATDSGAHVISMSLGGPSPSDAVKDAVDYAWNHGVVIVAAAGNTYDSVSHYPAYYENCIAVAATDDDDVKASFSTYGDWVDVAAPGVSIFSTVPYKGYRGKYYAFKSGTSMATPHVAGLAGLLRATSYGGSNSSIRNRIESTAEKIPGTGFYWVHGRVNAYEAVYDGISNSPPSANDDSASTVEDTEVVIDVLANDIDADLGDTLTVTNLTQPVSGTATLNTLNGKETVTYTPSSGFIGTDTFTYTASDGMADSNVAIVTVTVKESINAPVAEAGPDQAIWVGENVAFDGSASYDIDGYIDSYSWDFGDGNSGTGETTNHVYGLAGTYIVVLTVTDDGGLTDTDEATVTVKEASDYHTMHISDIGMSLSSRPAGRNVFVKAIAAVTIVDVDDNPVEGAIVYGHWEGATTDADYGITGPDGALSLESDEVKNPSSGITFVFVVDNITSDWYDYEPAENVESSDSITVP